MLFVSIVGSMEINRRHYFRIGLNNNNNNNNNTSNEAKRNNESTKWKFVCLSDNQFPSPDINDHIYANDLQDFNLCLLREGHKLHAIFHSFNVIGLSLHAQSATFLLFHVNPSIKKCSATIFDNMANSVCSTY